MNTTNKKILVITPHTDDELFGCGGALLKIKEQNNCKIKIAVMSCSDRFLFHLNRVVTKEEQWQEFKDCCSFISNEPPARFNIDQRLEEVPIYKIVRWLDELVKDYEPTDIFICEPSYHQEHKIVYETVISACRPTFNQKSIKNIYLYEIPTSNWSGVENLYKPNIYVDITNFIDKKIAIFKNCYKLQYTEEKRNMLGEKGIISHAKYRGIESGHSYSESFMLIKSTEYF